MFSPDILLKYFGSEAQPGKLKAPGTDKPLRLQLVYKNNPN